MFKEKMPEISIAATIVAFVMYFFAGFSVIGQMVGIFHIIDEYGVNFELIMLIVGILAPIISAIVFTKQKSMASSITHISVTSVGTIIVLTQLNLFVSLSMLGVLALLLTIGSIVLTVVYSIQNEIFQSKTITSNNEEDED